MPVNTGIEPGFNYDDAITRVYNLLNLDMSVMLTGSPGVGKSSMAAELAEKFNLEMVDIRLAQKDPAEIGGVYVPNRETRRIELFCPDWVPLDKPKLIFLDELNAGVSKIHQSIAYQIILEHRIGPFKFAPGTKVLAAGNKMDDNAIAVELSSALNNRFAHVIVKPDLNVWLNWAAKKYGLSADYLAFIAFKGLPALFNNNGEVAWPSPRSNADAAKCANADLIIADTDQLKRDIARDLVASKVGEAQAIEFMKFREVYSKVNILDILEKGIIPNVSMGAANGTGEASFLYSMIYACDSYIAAMKPEQFRGLLATNTVKLLMELGKRAEFQYVFARLLCKHKDHFMAIRSLPEAKKVMPVMAEFLRDAGLSTVDKKAA